MPGFNIMSSNRESAWPRSSSPSVSSEDTRSGGRGGCAGGRSFASIGYLGQARTDGRSLSGGDGRRIDVTWSGPGAGMPVHEAGDDLFADSDWYSSSRSSSRWNLSGAVRWLWGSSREGGRRAMREPPAAGSLDLFALDEPLLERATSEVNGWRCCGCRGSGERETGQEEPRLTPQRACCFTVAALSVILAVCCIFTSQLIQFSVDCSGLSFARVNITLPPPPRSTLDANARTASQIFVRIQEDLSREQDFGTVIAIGFDSVVSISAPALWMWPWTARIGGGNFTLEFCLREAAEDGDGEGDGRFVPCKVGELYLPPIALQGGQSAFDVPIVGGLLHVSPSNECFRGFSRGMLVADKLWTTLRGSSDMELVVSAGTATWSIGFPEVRVHKSVPMQGMDQFRAPASPHQGGSQPASGDEEAQGVRATDICLNSSTSTSIIAQIKLEIPNPSVLQLGPLGDMSLVVHYAGVTLGVFDVDRAWDMVRRGRNTALVRGKLDVAQDDLESASGLFSALLANRRVSLLASLARSSNPIIAQGLRDVAINTTIAAPPMRLLGPEGIEILSCNIVPRNANRYEQFAAVAAGGALGLSAQKGWSEVSIEVKVQVAVARLLGKSPMNVTKMSASSVLLGYRNKTVAAFELPEHQVPADMQSSRFLVISTSAVARVDDSGFGQFVGDFMTIETLSFSLRAAVSATVDTVLGPLSIEQVPIQQSMSQPGANGFPDAQVLDFDVSGGGRELLQVLAKAKVYNPSQVSATLGAVTMELSYQGSVLGHVTCASLTLVPGANVLQLSGAVEPFGAAAVSALGDLVGGYLRGDVVMPSVRCV